MIETPTHASTLNYIEHLADRYKGAASYHEGGPADERMMDAASKRGIDITSLSRPLRPEDLSAFDYIIAMDYENMAAIQVAADFWSMSQPVPKDYRKRVSWPAILGAAHVAEPQVPISL